MKGVVFTELLEMVESEYGFEVVDYMLNTDLPSGGYYTSVGEYTLEEFGILRSRFIEHTRVSGDVFDVHLGRHIMKHLAANESQYFERHTNALEFIADINHFFLEYTHRTNPTIVMPEITADPVVGREMSLVYRSFRKMGGFMEGLFRGVFEYYGEQCEIQWQAINSEGDRIKFKIVSVE